MLKQNQDFSWADKLLCSFLSRPISGSSKVPALWPACGLCPCRGLGLLQDFIAINWLFTSEVLFVTVITTTRALTKPINEHLTALWGCSSLCPSMTIWTVQLLPQQLTLLQSNSGQPPVAPLGEFTLNVDFAKPEWDYFYACMSWLWTTYWVINISKTLEVSVLSFSFTDVHEEEILKAYLGVWTQFHSYRY